MRIGRLRPNPPLPGGVTPFGLFVFACIVLVNLSILYHPRGNQQQVVATTKSSHSYKYRGAQYWNDLGATLNVTTLYETKFARFQIHKVLLEDGKTIVDDWMWMDESDNVNVLIQNEKGNYLVFHQRKYAIVGRTYAVLGGLVEPGEDPVMAAQRELKEELQMTSKEWVSMGAYRAAANRGGGTTYTFLARYTRPIISETVKTMRPKNDFSEGESERQDVLELSKKELVEALLAGKFQEIKWTATVALALLQQEYQLLQPAKQESNLMMV
jgi:ADP-ribose pyrophosphatase